MKHNHYPSQIGRAAFLMDPMEKIAYWEDTSCALMEEIGRRGTSIYYLEPKNISAENGTLHGKGQLVRVSCARGVGIKILKNVEVDLGTMDVIVNRKEPPFDIAYLHLTQMLELLESKVFIVNSPRGLRKANEKLYILNFLDWIPETLVTQDPGQIMEFQRRIKSDVILKPLDQKGGAGISLLTEKTKGNKALLERMTRGGKQLIMAQKFLKSNLTQGDKRIFVLDGKVIGQFKRIPKRGEFRANLSLGAHAEEATLSKQEKKLVHALVPALRRDGLYFTGLDVVDGKLIEINVTCPAGFLELLHLNGKNLAVDVVNFLERKAF